MTNMPSGSGICFIGVGSGAMTPLVRLARSKVIHSVGVPFDNGPTTGAPRTGTARDDVSPHDFLARRVLVSGSDTGVTRLITGRVCDVHRDGGTLLHNRTSGVPGSNTRLGLVLSGLGRRRATVARVFSNGVGGRPGAFAVQLAPGRVGSRITFHFSQGLKIITGGSLTNRPCCVDIASLGDPSMSTARRNGGGISNMTCGLPNGTRIALVCGGGGLFSSRLPVARFNAMRCLTPMLFGGGSAVGILFSATAKKLVGISERWEGSGSKLSAKWVRPCTATLHEQ